MRRLGRLLLGVLAALLLLVFGGIGETRSGGAILAVLVVAAIGWALWGFVQRRRPIAAEGWTPTASVTYRPAEARPPATSAGVPSALARVEARELTTSTSFGVGVGFCALALVLFGRVFAGDYGGDLPNVFEFTPVLTHPLAGMIVLAAFRARTRSRRDGVDELFTTCPTSDDTRTLGHLFTAWAAAAIALLYVVVLVAMEAQASPTLFGDVGARQIGALVGSALLCVGAVCLGVALARWLPWTLVPVVAVAAVGFGAANLATRGTRTTEPLRQLSTFLVDPELDLRLTAPHWVAHHLWIVALVLTVAVLALLRDRRGPAVVGAGLLAVALAVASGIAATRPISTTDARRIAALVNDPAQQPCIDAGGLAVCTYKGDDELADDLAAAVRPVAAGARPGALDGWSVRQGRDTRRRNLDPEVLALVGEPVTDHVLPIEFTAHPLALEGLRLWTGLAAVGLLDTWIPDSTMDIRGQARGTIALWLATRGANESSQLHLTSVGSGESTGRNAVRPWPDTCFAGEAPVRWAASDVDAARTLLSLPEDRVRRVVLEGWATFTDRAATTDDLLRALRLPPTGVHGETPNTSAC